MTAAIAGVWAVENDDDVGEDVDCSVPETNDKVDVTVVDRCDLEATSSTKPCLPVPVSSC